MILHLGEQRIGQLSWKRRGADGVSWRDFPDPKPGPNESVLRVVGSALNRVDLYMRNVGAAITTIACD